MKKLHSVVILAFVFLFLPGCGDNNVKTDFQIESNNPASALTIGWYVAPEVVKELVGKNFSPKIVNDKNETSIFLFIAASEEHRVDDTASAIMEIAHLLVPVEEVNQIKSEKGIENFLVCPITIVDQSQRLGNKYNSFGFPTYSGDIRLEVNNTGNKYMVDASVNTVNGSIGIKAMFEEDAVEHNLSSAIFTSKPGNRSYFSGEESFKRISNGKGNLSTGGQNIISAMNLNKQPYYRKLDLDCIWAFAFQEK